MIILGCDPGDSSFGITILDISENRFDIALIGMNNFTISNLTPNTKLPSKSKRRKKAPDVRIASFIDQVYAYKFNIKTIIKKYNIDLCASERFMTRGIKGKSIECVSMMNGITACLALDQDIPFILYPAAAWKNSINKIVDLKELYKETKLKPHEIDSAYIALTAYLKTNNIEWTSPKCKRLILKLKRKLIDYERI